VISLKEPGCIPGAFVRAAFFAGVMASSSAANRVVSGDFGYRSSEI
jgi:hypothetical protein